MRQHHALGLVALILAFVFTPASPADSAGLSFETNLPS